MTVLTEPDEVVASPECPARKNPVPAWVPASVQRWGSRLVVDEWEKGHQYRKKNGWRGQDFIHDRQAPVHITDYYVNYGEADDASGLASGGPGTELTGIVVFTERAESHSGFCHGGSMTAVMDDVIGWTGFCATGRLVCWSGFTVQVNTSLQRPIAVNSTMLVQGRIVKIERRKVFIEAVLLDPANDDAVHAKAEGIVVLNHGVLPLPHQESTDSVASF